MKKVFFAILVMSLIFNLPLIAQKEIVVTPVTKQMSRGNQPGFMVNIPEAKLESVANAYRKRLEEKTKTNSKEIEGELINYGVVNTNVSQTPFIVYAKLIETLEGVEMTAYFTMDSINFISENSDPDKMAVIKKTLHEFAASEYQKVATKQLEVEKDKLSELKKTLDKQMSDEKSNTKEISSKQREIEKYKTNITENKAEQTAKIELIGKQQKMIENINDKNSAEHDLATKNLKKYEGEKKDLIKSEEKLNRNIDDNTAEIKELEQDNEELKKQQEDSKQKIDAQQTIVNAADAKLKGIK